MPPKLLVIVSSARHPARIPVTITDPEQWKDVGCLTCGRRIDADPIVFLVDPGPEVRCRRCLEQEPQRNGCIWCGRRPARKQDTGHRYCQPCWTIYVAYVSDEVEPPDSPFNRVMTDLWVVNQLKEIARADSERNHPPEGEDRPTGDGDPGPELGADQRLPRAGPA